VTLQGFLSLAWQTVQTPRDVARLLLAARLGRDALWTAFALVCTANALVYGTSLAMAGPGSIDFLQSPSLFLAMQALVLAGTILCLTYAGRGLGGAGRVSDIAVLMVWMQALRVLVQLIMLGLVVISPVLASMLVGLSLVLGIWIALNFVREAHGFDSLVPAGLTMIFGFAGAIFGLSIILTLIGVDPNGVMNDL